jgi:hypothetical protein
MQELVSTWNLTQMHDYVMCKDEAHICNYVGFNAILDKFNNHKTKDKNYPNGRREFESSDRPERLKKAFDLVIIISRHPRSKIKTMKGIEVFVKSYMDIIVKYDKDHGAEYKKKILRSFRQGLLNIEKKMQSKKRMQNKTASKPRTQQ